MKRLLRTVSAAVATAVIAATSVAVTPAPAAATAASQPAAAANLAIVMQPRPFGHVVGDVLTQRVLLQLDGRDFAPAALPGAERLGIWLERRPARLEHGPDGRRWLVLDYQVINAPQTLTTIRLPAWQLRAAGGGAALHIDAWPLSVAPLTPRTAFSTGELAELRPDRPAPAIDTQPISRRIGLLSAALALTLGAWLVWWWWRNRFEAARLPFARAQREMRGLDDTAPPAWHSLHRAFDRTAGRALQASSLPVLFERAPHLQALRPQIETFYAHSGALFFGAGLPPQQALPVRALCGALRQLEKRHAR